MIKQIYATLTIILLFVNVYSLCKTIPTKMKERNNIKLVLVTFKNEQNDQIKKKYGEEEYKNFFSKTNETLKKSKKMIIVTRQKYIKHIKRNSNVASVTWGGAAAKYVSEEEIKELGSLPLLEDEHYVDILEYFFPQITILNLLNLFILLVIFIKRKTKKVSS